MFCPVRPRPVPVALFVRLLSALVRDPLQPASLLYSLVVRFVRIVSDLVRFPNPFDFL